MLSRLERSFTKEQELKEYEEARLNVPAIMTLVRAQVAASVKHLPQDKWQQVRTLISSVQAKLSALRAQGPWHKK